ncbi:hypothetical protein HYX17_03340 [Candidatus Woesearchaeota archaeon]|nr:hypothetical protein [Candidatus Woesearchaeota archaeon]
MRKIIALMILLLVVIVGCTKGTPETKLIEDTTTSTQVKETNNTLDISKDLSEAEESKDLELDELENLDLEIDENVFE